jgi:hypothetical protein
MANPNTQGISKELTFKVIQREVTEEEYPETLRAISLNGGQPVARAAE